MPAYYFDLEVTSLNPAYGKIITIQYQPIDIETGDPLGELTILKEWESSEKEILRKFIPIFMGTKPFDFIPVGMNLSFDFNFLRFRTLLNLGEVIDINWLFLGPHLDIKPIIVMMNKGKFKGASLNLFSEKELDPSKIPLWYEYREYDKIIEYIKQEAQAFLKLYKTLAEELPNIRRKLTV